MTLVEVMALLEGLGDAKVRARNMAQGAGENQFGAPRGELRKVANQLKKQPELAMPLWQTGNEDAMCLATLLIKPRNLSADVIDALVHETPSAWVADWVNSYVVKESTHSDSLRTAWMDDQNVWVRRAAWSVTADRISKKSAGLDFGALLDRLEAEMPDAPDPAKWTMNFALGAIGIHHPAFRERESRLGSRSEPPRTIQLPKGASRLTCRSGWPRWSSAVTRLSPALVLASVVAGAFVRWDADALSNPVKFGPDDAASVNRVDIASRFANPSRDPAVGVCGRGGQNPDRNQGQGHRRRKQVPGESRHLSPDSRHGESPGLYDCPSMRRQNGSNPAFAAWSKTDSSSQTLSLLEAATATFSALI